MHAALTQQTLPNLLFFNHLLLLACPSAVQSCFSVKHSLFLPHQSLGTHLNNSLMVIAFPYNIIVPAIRPKHEVIPANGGMEAGLGLILSKGYRRQKAEHQPN
jgi:hypothetical protein